MAKDKLSELISKLKSDIMLYNHYKDAIITRKVELIAYMNKQGFQRIEKDGVKIALVQPTTILSFDTERFKADHEDLYNEYKTKESIRKAEIRVTIKEQSNEESCTTKR